MCMGFYSNLALQYDESKICGGLILFSENAFFS